MNNRSLIIVIIVAALSLLVGYLLLPEAQQKQFIESAGKISAETENLVQVFCDDSNDMPREYLIGLIQKEYPDYKIQDMCPK